MAVMIAPRSGHADMVMGRWYVCWWVVVGSHGS